MTSPTHWHVNPQTSSPLWGLLGALLAGLHHRAAHVCPCEKAARIVNVPKRATADLQQPPPPPLTLATTAPRRGEALPRRPGSEGSAVKTPRAPNVYRCSDAFRNPAEMCVPFLGGLVKCQKKKMQISRALNKITM